MINVDIAEKNFKKYKNPDMAFTLKYANAKVPAVPAIRTKIKNIPIKN